MRTALAVKEVADVPSSILAMKYLRLKLASGEIAGSKPVGTDSAKHRRRNYLLRIDSTEKRRRRDGRVVDVPVTTYGAVLHYAVVYVDGRPMAFARRGAGQVCAGQGRAKRLSCAEVGDRLFLKR